MQKTTQQTYKKTDEAILIYANRQTTVQIYFCHSREFSLIKQQDCILKYIGHIVKTFCQCKTTRYSKSCGDTGEVVIFSLPNAFKSHESTCISTFKLFLFAQLKLKPVHEENRYQLHCLMHLKAHE